MTAEQDTVVAALKTALAHHTSAVLAAPPGFGKTTLVPPALLTEPWLHGRRILLLVPRRLAARAAAARMAELAGEPVGKTIGYRTRFDTKVSAATRIEVITEGILTRKLQNDPALEDTGCVIFDEFHERNLIADLGLALCLDVQSALRDDLRLVVMSATVDTDRVARLLGRSAARAPVIEGHSRAFPVAIRHLSPKTGDLSGTPESMLGRRIAEETAGAITRALTEERGDILVFLPGGGEIRRVAQLVHPITEQLGAGLYPLYGDLPKAAQDRAIRPHPNGKRRVVLATDIAETSLTIEGVTTVVDCGFCRTPRFDATSGLTRLATVRISRASATQRTGRAGRTGPGVCYRLWPHELDGALLPNRPPEILHADLAPLLLDLALWGVTDPDRLCWLDPLPVGAVAQARELLGELGAIDHQGRITDQGRLMATLPVHPRLARMLVTGGRNAGDLAALLSERDILAARHGTRSTDIEDRLQLLAAFRRSGPAAMTGTGADPAGCRSIVQVSRDLAGRLPPSGKDTHKSSTGGLCSLAYPDRIARRREESRHRYQLTNGRGVTLSPNDPLAGSDYIVAAHAEAGSGEGRIFLAAELTKAELLRLHAKHIILNETVSWDTRQEMVVCRRDTRLHQLVLDSRPLTTIDPEEKRRAMLDGIRQLGLSCLPFTQEAKEFRNRVLFVSKKMPATGLPDLSDHALMDHLEDWLAPWLDGKSRRDQLGSLDLAAIFKAMLTWPQQKQLDALAPTHLTVPSGSKLRLSWDPDEGPVLAVRLQEMFGLAETPSVCQGHEPVTLHLLSPARRPIQITRDLTGFWNRTYPEVKKELAGRYPKHHWPDDPWAAPPTCRVKPRR